MIVYLDTNVYISAKYIFNSGYFGTLKNIVAAGKIAVLCTSATIGEVKQHIETDISAAVIKYNRLLRKDMPVLNDEPLYMHLFGACHLSYLSLELFNALHFIGKKE